MREHTVLLPIQIDRRLSADLSCLDIRFLADRLTDSAVNLADSQQALHRS